MVCERVDDFVKVVGWGRSGEGGDIATEVLAAGTAEDAATVSVCGLVSDEIIGRGGSLIR